MDRGVNGTVEQDDERICRGTALLAQRERAFWRTARRYSICGADADDAVQRAVLILLTKGPPHPSERLTRWMHLVTKREALAVRRERERLLGVEVGEHNGGWVAGPAEITERTEQCRERALPLARLKPHERRAVLLRAHGYSYAEICELTGWSYTKVNRCLAEGRARLRGLAVMT